jgi:peptidylprolyl isomerase
MVIDEDATYLVTIATNKGDMTFELDAGAAPMAVNNFICLATNDFYDIVPFHRVISGFMVQAGDPTGTGTGGPGYRFEEELPGDDLNYDRGTLAMARTQEPGSQGSQFFIVHQDLTDEQLAKNYTIFGKLVEGEDVLDDIADSAVIPGPSGEPSFPAEFLVIEDITVTVASGS